ncbi:ABC-type Fe3+-hydroxamate transport system, periplasmic component [Galbibacter orientalis DSM 19592]|uniref:ABC-type Fe3+-hydroxamate transport system, periplasmic component n=1 Tax=Galbibacter orientalis DSM 19592 TaxID=926559 RepID=I3C7E3_9FLAO|nr:helical backbone metal receptor [Galbibacter orientalis]EIJ39536.1 ABC-type Fe3+-hydroxamate transport system, periplasmic component [Galbibacter orientalis DSM 19592]
MKDQLGRHINLKSTPQRIISLVPSQTELLYDLGLEERIIGVTKFCVHPKRALVNKTVVGGTKDVKYELIQSLKPDVILCNKEENTKEIVSTLEKISTVHVSDIYTLQDSLALIKQYGELFSAENSAENLITTITSEWKSFKAFVKDASEKKVAYFIWRKPWMVAGNNTFIDFLLKENRFINAFGEKARYPEVLLSELKMMEDLDYILLSSEPFPFKQKHIDEIQRELPSVKIILVDGEYFSWYGSRLQNAFKYFESLYKKI